MLNDLDKEAPTAEQKAKEFAYVATKPCGCTSRILVDRPEWKKETAKDIAKWIREGCAVNRLPLHEAVIKVHRCECR